MSDFVVQMQKYDSQEIEDMILDLEQELQDEVDVKESLDGTTADKIEAAKQFMDENSEKIKEQLVKLQDLDSKIREAIAENQKLEEQDEIYSELVSSEPYTNLADQIKQIKAISASLVDFLLQEGRRGRPQKR